jgi:hypothetical protein
MHKKAIDHARRWLAIESSGLKRGTSDPSYEWFGCENDDELGREIEDSAAAEGIHLYPETNYLNSAVHCEGVDLVELEHVLSVMFHG